MGQLAEPLAAWLESDVVWCWLEEFVGWTLAPGCAPIISRFAIQIVGCAHSESATAPATWLQGRCTAQAYGVVQQIGPVAVPVFISLASAAEAADLDAQSEHSSSAET